MAKINLVKIVLRFIWFSKFSSKLLESTIYNYFNHTLNRKYALQYSVDIAGVQTKLLTWLKTKSDEL